MSKVKKIATLSIGQGINIIVNFLFLPYMARVLDYNDYGSYGQVLLIVAFVTALFSFGLSKIIFIYLNKSEIENEVLSTSLFSSILVGLIAFLVLFISAPFISEWLENNSLTVLIRCYSMAPILTITNQIISSFLIHKSRVRQIVILNVSSNLLKVIFVVFVIQVYESVFLALVAIAISYFYQLLLGLLFLKRHLSLYFRLKKVIDILKVGFPLGLTGILGSGILYVDGLMVSKFQGVESFAIYRNGAIEVPFLATIYSSIAAIVLPEVAKLFNDKKFKEIIGLKRKVIMNTLVLVTPVLVFLLFNANDLITLYLGEKYSESAIIFSVFNLTLLIRVNDYSDILIASNRGKLILQYYAMSFVLNILLNTVLIFYFGRVGAAIATVVSIGFLAAIQLNKSLNILNYKFRDLLDFQKFFRLLFILLGFAFLINSFSSMINYDIIRVLTFAVLYFVSIFYILIKYSYFDKDLVSRLIPNKIKKMIK